MSDFLKSPLLVTGAGGKLGRRVVELLLAAGATNVIAASRDTGKIADLAAKGATLRTADFDDAASLDAAFAGVERLLIISTDTLGVPGLRQKQHAAAVAAAVKAGVKHIVYTSMPNPEPGSKVLFAPDHYETEQRIKESGLGYTILRNSWYMENLLLGLPHSLAAGQWFSASGDGRITHVSREDTARAAAAALTTLTGSETLDVTGETPLTTAEIAALASSVFGKPLAVVPVTDEQLAAGLAASGMPAGFVPLVVSFDANTRAGGFNVVSDTVKRLTGSAPQTLKDFFIANKAAFVG